MRTFAALLLLCAGSEAINYFIAFQDTPDNAGVNISHIDPVEGKSIYAAYAPFPGGPLIGQRCFRETNYGLMLLSGGRVMIYDPSSRSFSARVFFFSLPSDGGDARYPIFDGTASILYLSESLIYTCPISKTTPAPACLTKPFDGSTASFLEEGCGAATVTSGTVNINYVSARTGEWQSLGTLKFSGAFLSGGIGIRSEADASDIESSSLAVVTDGRSWCGYYATTQTGAPLNKSCYLHNAYCPEVTAVPVPPNAEVAVSTLQRVFVDGESQQRLFVFTRVTGGPVAVHAAIPGLAATADQVVFSRDIPSVNSEDPVTFVAVS